MTRDTLFLLPPGFEANGQREFCPECAEIWGLIAWYPALKETVDIAYVGIAHPREPLVRLLGPGNHNAPTLVLAAGSPRATSVTYNEAGGHAFLPSARLIARHFAGLYGTPMPRGG
ncbi:conserved hypothetical protein [Hyphomonas neptunium ATCC 15444]|uniref:DUF3088 domain-containing protein n=2 Tax=Hyphomonas TaxID=85 RepID=Q0BX34_HYPNA|nr:MULTISPECIES: DUF3088 family protein [Hyphomonas]ABI76427.1 conserved hypothetical protein [Hyphomonas neptunium ATCC 15444]KCZ92041.1 hypothetical protein HHI_12449 [Hyphomonas hirschiana VP5]